jgi:cytochrome bd-type quinol oxidase subunit 2
VVSNEAEGFFPEREVLRARRLRAIAAEAVDPSAARARRNATGTAFWVAIFVPMFVILMTTGWDGHMTPHLAQLVIFALRLVLAACVAAVAIVIWKNLHRVRNS